MGDQLSTGPESRPAEQISLAGVGRGGGPEVLEVEGDAARAAPDHGAAVHPARRDGLEGLSSHRRRLELEGPGRTVGAGVLTEVIA